MRKELKVISIKAGSALFFGAVKPEKIEKELAPFVAAGWMPTFSVDVISNFLFIFKRFKIIVTLVREV